MREQCQDGRADKFMDLGDWLITGVADFSEARRSAL